MTTKPELTRLFEEMMAEKKEKELKSWIKDSADDILGEMINEYLMDWATKPKNQKELKALVEEHVREVIPDLITRWSKDLNVYFDN
jgi:hypothetical protein